MLPPDGSARGRWLALVVLLFAAALPACSGPTLAPTPNLYWGTGVHPFDDVPEALRTPEVELVYATDRRPVDKPRRHAVEYGYGRSHSLAMGRCTVRIGDTHDWEEIVEASTVRRRSRRVPLSVRGIEEVVRLPPSNTPREVIDGEFQESAEYLGALDDARERFHALLRERLALTPTKEVYVFVHGFANTFDDAAVRMGELWHFLGRQGVGVFYTWPAGRPGLLKGYNYDRESSEFTIFHLKQFIRMIGECPEVEEVHIVAHSRGTDVALASLRELWLEKRATDPEVRLVGNVVIAAADIDWDVLQQRLTAERIPSVLRNWVFYLSDDDRAISLSSWLFSSLMRLGQLDFDHLSQKQRENLSEIDDVQVIKVRVDAGFLGHSYFIDNPAVLSDLILVLTTGAPAGTDHGRPLQRLNDAFWVLDDGYPLDE